jgi:hypothetical protein
MRRLKPLPPSAIDEIWDYYQCIDQANPLAPTSVAAHDNIIAIFSKHGIRVTRDAAIKLAQEYLEHPEDGYYDYLADKNNR